MPTTKSLFTYDTKVKTAAPFIDRDSGKTCFAFRAPNGTTIFEIWDMKKNTVFDTFSSFPGEEVEELALSYPYLVTKSDTNIYLRDLDESDIPYLTSEVGRDKCDNFSINQHGFIFTIHPNSKLTQIFLAMFTRNRSLEYYLLKDVRTKHPIICLHENYLIYRETCGLLSCFDIQRVYDNMCAASYLPPEIAARYERLHDMDSIEFGLLLMNHRVTSMVAHKDTLVTLSREDLLIWNLATTDLIKRLPPIPKTRLSTLSGHTLISCEVVYDDFPVVRG